MRNSGEVTNPVPLRLALLLLVIGLLFALDSFLKLDVIHRLWPMLLAVTGIGLIGIFLKGHVRVPMFLIAGVYLVCFSGLALFCNFTSWAALGHLWPLFITFLAVVFVALFCFHQARRAYLTMGLLLASASVVFYLTLSVSARLWWTVFVLAGLSILVVEMLGWRNRSSS